MTTGYRLQYQIKNANTAGADYNVLPVTNAGINGAGIVVAVVDDGLQTDHPAFAGNYSAALSYDYSSGVPSPSGNADDGHGTGVAGVAVGNASWNGPVGVAPGATLEALRIDIGSAPVPGSPNEGKNAGDGKSAAFVQATRTADVMNNSYGDDGSLGGTVYGSAENKAVNAEQKTAVTTGRGGRGLIVVYAAGNEGSEGADVSFDADVSDPQVIAVGGIKADGTPTLGLTHGAGLLVSGPADAVVTARRYVDTGKLDANGLPAGSYEATGGTSFAAPGVSGVVALMLEVNPNLGWRDVQEILVDSARIPGANAVTKPDGTPWFTNSKTGDFNGGGRHFSNAYGYGVPDADVAVALARTWTESGTSANLVTAAVSGTPGTVVTGGGAVATTSLSYGASLRVQHVQVTLHAPALTVPNLLITLTAPDGTRSIVADQAGVDQSSATLGAGPHDPAALLDKDGNARMKADGSPLLNTAKLDFTINDAAFFGVDARGTWTLGITDYRTGETGTLDSWGLSFYGDSGTAPQTLVYTPEFAAMAAAEPTRTLVRPSATASSTTIDAAALTGTTTIDLRGGAGMLGGTAVTVQGGIANATGGRGTTTLIGTAGANQLIAGGGDTAFFGNGGADTVVGGGGRDIFESGGSSLLVTGHGGSVVGMGDGDTVLCQGADTVIAGGGSGIVGVFGVGIEMFGGAGQTTFINDTKASTVVGGAGSMTIFGGTGGGVLTGGSTGRNLIVAGTGAATVVGGGDGDLLFAQGAMAQLIAAGGGNETIVGGAASGNNTYFAGSGSTLIGLGAGRDTVFAGTGNATVVGGTGADLYAWANGRAGGATLVNGFNAAKGDRISLQGYAPGALQQALATAGVGPAGTTLTLSDNTRITFAGISSLGPAAFA